MRCVVEAVYESIIEIGDVVGGTWNSRANKSDIHIYSIRTADCFTQFEGGVGVGVIEDSIAAIEVDCFTGEICRVH